MASNDVGEKEAKTKLPLVFERDGEIFRIFDGGGGGILGTVLGAVLVIYDSRTTRLTLGLIGIAGGLLTASELVSLLR